uniref:Conotoxin superfamily conkunitzin 1 n=1 Tax=Conus magus TaxID=6492 RepID=A0A679P569_CONMA|nr:TPA_inf: conotoxin superfamily conkunitzin 1 [Conus magus]
MTCFRCAVYPLMLTAMVVVVATGNRCRLARDTGLCRAFMPRFYYNWNEQECQAFIYGGCGGNANRFQTLEECQRACRAPFRKSDCKLPKETGPCRALMPSYYYDLSTETCEPFIYGGCGGNANRFDTFAECKQRCAGICQEPKEVGLCRAAIPRWFYNRNTERCEQFIYGGCGGNRNNFQSLLECRDQCVLN